MILGVVCVFVDVCVGVAATLKALGRGNVVLEGEHGGRIHMVLSLLSLGTVEGVP